MIVPRDCRVYIDGRELGERLSINDCMNGRRIEQLIDWPAPTTFSIGYLDGCHRQQFGRTGKGERKRNRKDRWR